MDVVDKATRSRVMSKIRGRDTGPELRVAEALKSLGVRVVRQYPEAGRPDFAVLWSLNGCPNTLIFVDGCFWHLHEACGAKRRAMRALPKMERREYWEKKLVGGVARNAKIRRKLRRDGWRVLTVWECQTTDEERLRSLLRGRLRIKPAR
jgi:DNA mismatch endonuclease (patch repair protein)